MDINDQLQEDLKELVIARLDSTLPPDATVSIGARSSLSKKELINHIKQNDKIGKKFIEIELKYLQALKEGSLYEFPSNN